MIGFFIGSLLAASSFRTPLYIDNGSSGPVTVAVNRKKTMQVPAKGFVETSVPTGYNEILVNGKLRKLNLKDEGNWVFNIDLSTRITRVL